MIQRYIIIIVIILFVTPIFAQVNAQDNNAHGKTSYSIVHHESGSCVNALLKENSEEKNEANKTILAAELIDFSFQASVLTQYHSRVDGNTGNLPLTREPLFMLHCNFLI